MSLVKGDDLLETCFEEKFVMGESGLSALLEDGDACGLRRAAAALLGLAMEEEDKVLKSRKSFTLKTDSLRDKGAPNGDARADAVTKVCHT